MLESTVNMDNNSDEDSCASVREAKKKSLPSVNLLSPDSLPASKKKKKKKKNCLGVTLTRL